MFAKIEILNQRTGNALGQSICASPELSFWQAHDMHGRPSIALSHSSHFINFEKVLITALPGAKFVCWLWLMQRQKALLAYETLAYLRPGGAPKGVPAIGTLLATEVQQPLHFILPHCSF